MVRAAAYCLCHVLSVWTPRPWQADTGACRAPRKPDQQEPGEGPRTTPAGLVQTEPMKGWGQGDVTLDGARLGPGLATRRVF